MISCSSRHNVPSETFCRLSVEFLNIKELLLIYQKQRNLDARKELVKRYVPAAEMLSEKYVNREVKYEDLYRVASQGLINAIDRFDPERGFEVPGFVISIIIGEIKKYVRDTGWYARAPQRIEELSEKMNSSKTLLMQELNRDPKISDVAAHLNCTEEEIIEAMEVDWKKSPTPDKRYKCEFMKFIQ